MYPIHQSLLQSYAGMSGTFIPEIWSAKLLEKFYEATVFAQICNTDYEGEIRAFGDTVNIRERADVTTFDYELGMDINYERPASTKQILKIDRGVGYAAVIDSVERKQADINFVNSWAEDASEKTKIRIDQNLLGEVHSYAAQYNYGPNSGKICRTINLGDVNTDGSSALALTKSNIIDYLALCGQVLDEQNIPETSRWIVLPAWACTRIKISWLQDASASGDGTSTVRSGRLGRIDRFTIYNSNNILPVVEGSVRCYPALFGHKSAITFASQLTENEVIPNPSTYGKLMRGLQVYGFKVVQPTALGRLYCKPGDLLG
jgi:hypothetical protein